MDTLQYLRETYIRLREEAEHLINDADATPEDQIAALDRAPWALHDTPVELVLELMDHPKFSLYVFLDELAALRSDPVNQKILESLLSEYESNPSSRALSDLAQRAEKLWAERVETAPLVFQLLKARMKEESRQSYRPLTTYKNVALMIHLSKLPSSMLIELLKSDNLTGLDWFTCVALLLDYKDSEVDQLLKDTANVFDPILDTHHSVWDLGSAHLSKSNENDAILKVLQLLDDDQSKDFIICLKSTLGPAKFSYFVKMMPRDLNRLPEWFWDKLVTRESNANLLKNLIIKGFISHSNAVSMINHDHTVNWYVMQAAQSGEVEDVDFVKRALISVGSLNDQGLEELPLSWIATLVSNAANDEQGSSH